MKTLSVLILTTATLFLIANVSAQTPGAKYQSSNFQYMTGVLTSSSTTSNVINAWNSENLPKYFSLAITATAAPAIVALECSLDNSSWTQIGVTNTPIGMVSVSTPTPCIYARMRAKAIGATVSVTSTAVGVW